MNRCYPRKYRSIFGRAFLTGIFALALTGSQNIGVAEARAHARHHHAHYSYAGAWGSYGPHRERHAGYNSGSLLGGMASVYSGGRTASGQHMRSGELTAAHRTLPFGTKVTVVNRSNGRSVVVRINDRGPFVRGRVIDLSPAAARAIGVNGVSRVSLSVGGGAF
jgi:rare lipoprotein A